MPEHGGDVLVLGGRYDPATPYHWALEVTDLIPRARLLTYDGDGHTSFGGHSPCIDAAVTEFLLAGTLPPEGAECPGGVA